MTVWETDRPPALWDESNRIYCVPIRHHSPACSAHLERLLDAVRPRQVLIEGPVDFTPLLGLLTDPQTRPPVAVVSFPQGREAVFRSAYFPLCAHSPELVALRWAKGRAEVHWLDLPSDHRLLSTEPDGDADQKDRPVNLADDHHFGSSEYSAALCARTGCRDHNELWDHLFESRIGETDWRAFFAAVGLYCVHLRATCTDEGLRADGTLAREAQMAALVAKALLQPGPHVIVTGGFHTPAILRALARPGTPAGLELESSSRSFLIRYGYRQLDRLSGYAAGMVAPHYYDRLWQSRQSGGFSRLALDLLSDFKTSLAEVKGLATPPFPAFVTALENAERLAQLRGHPGPLREDLLDGCRSAFLKGEEGGDTAPLMEQLNEFFTGSKLGDIPPSAGSPPLLEAVRRRGRSLRFSVKDGERRRRSLDIYRKPTHRDASRFLHAMRLLETGFATLEAGPDYKSSVQLDRLHEHWLYAWSPLVESRLIEWAAEAETLESACLLELHRRLDALYQEGRGRDAVAATQLFYAACQAGLQAHLEGLLPMVEQQIDTDPLLAHVVEVARLLVVLWQANAVLDTVDSPVVEQLIAVAYRRAVFLLADLEQADETHLGANLAALADLHVLMELAADSPQVDAERFQETIASLLQASLAPALAGAVAALAYLMQLLEGAELLRQFEGHLRGAHPDAEERTAFLRGVLAISRELLWRLPGLVNRISEFLRGAGDDEFIELLPHLRLALAALDPRETDKLAATVAEQMGCSEAEVQGGLSYTLTEEAVQVNLAFNQRLREQLRQDGLGDWLPTEPVE